MCTSIMYRHREIRNRVEKGAASEAIVKDIMEKFLLHNAAAGEARGADQSEGFVRQTQQGGEDPWHQTLG